MRVYLTKGDLRPALEDQLLRPDGTPEDLTGIQSVKLNYQNLRTGAVGSGGATVVQPATDGNVDYQWVAADVANVGDYIGDWEVKFADGKTAHYPNDGQHFEFRIAPSASAPMAIAAFRKFIRTMLGDSGPDIFQFSADELDDAVRLTVNLGRATGVSLTADGLGLTPTVSPADPAQALNWAKIVYHSAKLFIMPNASSSSFRTRGLSEHFGESKERVFELLNEIYELDNGVGVE